MALVIGTSPNVSILDFAASYNLNTQYPTFTNQSTYIGGGAAATKGLNFTLTSPSGIIYHENTATGASSDITPTASTTTFTPTEQMPSFLGAIEYGNWVALITLTDVDNTQYTLSKTLNICKPKQDCTQVKNSSDSCADITFVANCNTNVTVYNDSTIYSYKGQLYSEITYDVSMTYPANAALSPIANANVAFFQTSPVFNGVYQFVISNTATYEFTDSQSVIIVYKLNKDFTISCTIGMCDILCAYAEYIEEYIDTKNNNASSQKARTMQENLLLLNAYVQEAQLGLECGNDISDLVVKIEAIIGKKCDCCGGANNNQGIVTTTNLIVEEGCGDISIETTTVGNTVTWEISDIHYVVTTDSAGVTVTKETAGCTDTFTIDVCLENLQLCNSVVVVSDGDGGSTVVSGGGTILDIVDAINIGLDTLDDRDTALEAEDVVLQAQITALAVESWKTIGGGGTFVNGQSVPALSTAINPAANTSWTDAGGTTFKDTDIGMNLRARYNPQTNMVDLNGTITITAGSQNAPIVQMPTGYIPTRQQVINAVCMDTSAANNAHESKQPIFIYVRSSGQIRCAVNTPLAVGTDYVICYINGSYALN